MTLHYTVDGPADAPVLVLGSSLGTTNRMWEPQLPALTSRLRVVRYDHRGHGGSPVPDGPYTIAELGRDVLGVLDDLGVERAHVGGLSLGGMVSMWIAANAPSRVERLVLMCTSAKLGPPENWINRAATVRASGIEPIADTVVGRWLPKEYAARHPEVLAELRAALVSTPPEGYAACCDAIRVMDLQPDLPSITAPALIIAGLVDEATPPTHAQRIAALIPGCRLSLVAGAAHLANVSRPDVISDQLLTFLTEDLTEDLA
jgi:3-oxoadipate enol-lactonase